ncbi:hypothetical protein [Tabrizicola oligotrophica]|uniref:Uncharacterized protein n=1 Tax=Tabrizicola oligotrophica TaxID=2710650 RepID=A0A6M0QXD1_9RHOB|nr:hypothetical protein [Tabrizicola oligotrophica]NEY92158.1 hypothetical protein [Tabrizicola oligotrophica]
MSETCDLSPEEWAHELHYMAKAGFGDLVLACEGLDPNGVPAHDLKAQITTAFGLVTSGLEMEPEALAGNLGEFLRAAEGADPAARAEAMGIALTNLSAAVGFDIAA